MNEENKGDYDKISNIEVKKRIDGLVYSIAGLIIEMDRHSPFLKMLFPIYDKLNLINDVLGEQDD